MESSNTNSSKFIDGEALIDSFKLKNSENLPLYIKSIWKDLSRRSDDSEKGFDKVVFSNYYDLPGLISTRLFNLFDKNEDGYLCYNEFSKGMMTLFNSSVEELMHFVFNLFDENKDGFISSEDIRSLFQYIPLHKKISDQSFKDRLDSQEEIFDLIGSFFKDTEKIDNKQFIDHTVKENSTVFLYIIVFLLTNKPFSDHTLTFFKKENGTELKKSSTGENKEKKNQVFMPSPNLTSKFSPSLKILRSPIMKKEKDNFKRELQRSLSQNIPSKANANNNLYNNKTTEFDKKDNLLDTSNDKELLPPSRVTWVVNNDGKMTEIDLDPSQILNALDSAIPNQEEAVSFEGYLVKLVDDKLKKLWFTLYEKYLYCK